MRIKVSNVSYENIKKLDFELNSNRITAVIGESIETNELMLKLLCGNVLQESGEIKLGRTSLNKKEVSKYRKIASYFGSDYEDMLFSSNIYEDIKNITGKISKNKIYDLLEEFGLEREILKTNYTCLSKSEKAKICLIALILKDSKIIALMNPTNYLDNKAKNALLRILKKFKLDKLGSKIVVISSLDSNFLMEACDDVIVIENGQIIKKSDEYEIFEDVGLLKVASMDMPNVIKFRKKMMESKKIKLGYRDNINDLIKDVYRNVK